MSIFAARELLPLRCISPRVAPLLRNSHHTTSFRNSVRSFLFAYLYRSNLLPLAIKERSRASTDLSFAARELLPLRCISSRVAPLLRNSHHTTSFRNSVRSFLFAYLYRSNLLPLAIKERSRASTDLSFAARELIHLNI